MSNCSWFTVPIPSMHGIFTYIWVIFMVNVGKYTIHGSAGVWMILLLFDVLLIWWWSRCGWPWFCGVPWIFAPQVLLLWTSAKIQKQKHIWNTSPVFFVYTLLFVSQTVSELQMRNYHQPDCVLFDGIISIGKIVIPSVSWLTETENGFMESKYLCVAFRWFKKTPLAHHLTFGLF